MLAFLGKRLFFLAFTMLVVSALAFAAFEFTPGQVARKVLGSFATRCHRKVGPICDGQAPPERRAGNGHRIACHTPLDELAATEPIRF